MRRLIIVTTVVGVIMLLSLSEAFCDTIPTWKKTYIEEGFDYMPCNGIIQNGDGSFLGVGRADPIGTSQTDSYLLKVSSSGQKEKFTLFHKEGENIELQCLTESYESDKYVICGRITKGGSNSNYVFLTDEDGHIFWERFYAPNSWLSYIEKTSDGNYIICGNCENQGQDDVQDLYVLKIDHSGEVIWENRIPMAYEHNYNLCVKEDRNGDYVATAKIGAWDAYVYKLDKNDGHIIWDYTFDEGRYEMATCVVEDLNSDLVVNIRSSDNLGHNNILILVKLDSDGNEIKRQTIDVGGSGVASDMVLTAENNYVFCGLLGDAASQVLLVMVDSDFNKIWQRLYQAYEGPMGYNGATCMSKVAEGGYILGGYHSGCSEFDEAFLLKTNRKGMIMPSLIHPAGSMDN